MAKFIEEVYYGNLDPQAHHRNRKQRTYIHLTPNLDQLGRGFFNIGLRKCIKNVIL